MSKLQRREIEEGTESIYNRSQFVAREAMITCSLLISKMESSILITWK